jgi:hypothetical protein
MSDIPVTLGSWTIPVHQLPASTNYATACPPEKQVNYQLQFYPWRQYSSCCVNVLIRVCASATHRHRCWRLCFPFSCNELTSLRNMLGFFCFVSNFSSSSSFSLKLLFSLITRYIPRSAKNNKKNWWIFIIYGWFSDSVIHTFCISWKYCRNQIWYVGLQF